MQDKIQPRIFQSQASTLDISASHISTPNHCRHSMGCSTFPSWTFQSQALTLDISTSHNSTPDILIAELPTGCSTFHSRTYPSQGSTPIKEFIVEEFKVEKSLGLASPGFKAWGWEVQGWNVLKSYFHAVSNSSVCVLNLWAGNNSKIASWPNYVGENWMNWRTK